MKYKVGDKVRIKSLDWYNENKGNADKTNSVWCKDGGGWFFYHMSQYCGKIMTIENVWANSYKLEGSDSRWTDEMIEGLVEEEVSYDTESEWLKHEISLPKGYIFKDENGNEILTSKIILEKKKKEYPKTYEECYCVLLERASARNMFGYKADLMVALQKLLVCRDAYWKIAGEEMGLGKPWEPNWTSFEGYPAIYMYRYQITLSVAKDVHHCLVFPTEEMRDAFYENFKELIEQCKELL